MMNTWLNGILSGIVVFLSINTPQSLALQPSAILNSDKKRFVHATVFDQETQKPIRGATLYLKNIRTGAVSGGVSDSTGAVTSKNIEPGTYQVVISYLGYTKHRDTLELNTNTPVQLGTIRLLPAINRMDAVSVTAEREQMEFHLDKKVFNVSQTILPAGGTATDVLRQIPTVEVDVTGAISLRGNNNLVVQLNGKQSGFSGAELAMLLEQIPASMIEKIEIITNPSARYDAEGMAGIINIITKISTTQRWNVLANVGVGTNHKYNASMDFGYRKGDWNTRIGYSYRSNRQNVFHGVVEQETFDPVRSESLGFLRQEIFNIFEIRGHFLKFNADYTIIPNGTLSGNLQLRDNTGNNDEQITSGRLSATHLPMMFTEQNNATSRSWRGFDASLGYKQLFSGKEHYLDVSARHAATRNQHPAHFTEVELTVDRLPLGIPAHEKHNQFGYAMSFSSLQGDYVQPLTIGKFEAGIKAVRRLITTDFYADSLQLATSTFIPDTRLINTFFYDEQLWAVYGLLAVQWKDFSIQAGLRVERTNIGTVQVIGNEHGRSEYWSVFPSLHLMKKFNQEHELQFSYSRRINRPQSGDLNPFTDYSNPLFLRRGNPDLKPELVNSFEVTYRLQHERLTFTATAYFRQTANLIAQLVNLNDKGTTTMRPENISAAYNSGFESVLRGTILTGWTATANVNIWYNFLQNTTQSAAINTGFATGTARLMSSASMPWLGGTVQAQYSYNGRNLLPQGERRAFHELTLGFRQELTKELSLTLSVTDVLNTRELLTLYTTNELYRQSRNKPETRILSLNVSWNIGATQLEQPRRLPQDGGVDL